jgi:hypothetical protein
MDDDEQHLVVFFAGLLQGQQFIQFEILGISGHRYLLSGE